MSPYTVDKIVSWILGAGIVLLILAAIGVFADVKAGETCKVPLERAISMAPKGTVFGQADKVAFQKLYDKFNLQRMSLGWGFTRADKLIVGLFTDGSVSVYMTLDNCFVKGTDAMLDIGEWKQTMIDVGITTDNFVAVNTGKEVSL